ncbi:putative cyclase-associated protein [Toxoplasma gondii TgCatPRC2]|uniref:Adenylyl cyclase associated protein n=13 Tax=Toxoplasma gondii TaxID=5811 RepID=B9PJM1_TOXGV|nr:cyclase-associated protein, putative [Toxoplasma gondii ME49]EPR60878.1 putative cyclase-associated protein [Toxoplasma gondii GT1]ESS34840.1 putative cyclase-associated protein [Toxoplasma gondii VEG]KFG40779.1 putative cyclase-associated protein [Toxoplasma gondii p89]KFG44605.1 putative cyclase-associated protein [Toxoplasma gondii GAB2-2007-GAL-DOM2]KFG55772.1 putative cyclase-associated protein [Toxoplasma gondii FOU]KFG65749.1 putative cyclase-associated protein [Toxoplasma gondii RU|eukprot:XP_002364249.1 cyclase-associated protein, putative [Toxoplasma gondii ME49]
MVLSSCTCLQFVHGNKEQTKIKIPKAGESTATDSGTMAKTGAEQLELHGDTWRVCNFVDKKDIIKIDSATMKQKVQIRDCKGVGIQIESKVNSVIIDNCDNLRLCVNSLISGAEFVNCRKIKFQVKGTCHSIAIDKCSGVDLYVSKESKDVEVTTSKSGEMNLNFPKTDEEDGDWAEVPIPEQFHHNIKNGVLHTRVSELYSC